MAGDLLGGFRQKCRGINFFYTGDVCSSADEQRLGPGLICIHQ